MAASARWKTQGWSPGVRGARSRGMENVALNDIPIGGGRKGVLKPQNRTEVRQKTANRIGFFLEYRNRTYMEAHCMKADVSKTCDIFW